MGEDMSSHPTKECDEVTAGRGWKRDGRCGEQVLRGTAELVAIVVTGG